MKNLSEGVQCFFNYKDLPDNARVLNDKLVIDPVYYNNSGKYSCSNWNRYYRTNVATTVHFVPKGTVLL